MFKNRNAKKVSLYGLGGLIGLCSGLWILHAFINAGNVPTYQAQKQKYELMNESSLSNHKSSINQEYGQSKKRLDQAEEIERATANRGSGQCSLQCESALTSLAEGSELDDETFQGLAAHIKEIAAYMQNHENQRQYYLQMALTTSDSDKRAFLNAIFEQLPYSQKVEIGEHFIGSDNWQVRADGVTLIADQGASNLIEANRLMDIFSNEQHSYVKSNILGYLEHSAALKGDTEILNQIDSAIYNETNPSVRVAALKAKMQLSEQLHHILPDALQALRTSDPEVQLAGLFALEKVLQHDKKLNGSGVYIDRNAIKNEFRIIRDLAVYDREGKHTDRLAREANMIYSRYFEQ